MPGMYSGWCREAKASANRRQSRIGLGKFANHKGVHARKRRRPQRVAEYSEYMNSPEWLEKRRLFFADPDLPKTCMVCGGDDVELHHWTYERLGFELLTDLVPLCHAHHLELHRRDPLAGRSGGFAAFRKSLIYDFGIGTIEVDKMLLPYWTAMRQYSRNYGRRFRRR